MKNEINGPACPECEATTWSQEIAGDDYECLNCNYQMNDDKWILAILKEINDSVKEPSIEKIDNFLGPKRFTDFNAGIEFKNKLPIAKQDK